MIDITDRQYKCFAYVGGGCTVLTKTNCTGCNFYKPIDCDDWIRLEQDGRIMLVPPEEYDEMNRRKEKKKNDRRARIFGKGFVY